jgi:PAS domain S-box-containing protein
MEAQPFSWPRVLSNFPLRGWKAWALVVLAYLGLYAVWLAFRTDSRVPRVLVGSLALVPPGLFASAAALSLAFRLRGRRAARHARLRRAWTFVGLAMLMLALGDLILAFYKLFLRMEAPLPALADPVSLVAYPLAFVGLLSFPLPPRGRFGRLRLLLDLTITAGAITVLGWMAVVRPILDATAARPTEIFWAAILPTADLALLLILLNIFVISEPGELRSALGFVSAGLATFVVTDLTYNVLALQGQFQAGGPLDLGWMVGAGLIGLGALFQQEHLSEREPAGEGTLRLRFTRRLQAILPLAAAIALGWYTLLDWQATGQPDTLAVWATSLLGTALVARQGVITGEVELGQYAHLVNSTADPAFICDAEGRLQLVNPALLAAAGYAHEDDLLGQSALRLLAPGALFVERGLQPEHLFTLGLERGWSGEVNLRRRDGSEFPVDLSLRPVRSETASRPALAGTAHDLTGAKRQEAALRAAYDEVAAARRALEALNAQLEERVEEKTRSLSEAYDQLARQNEALKTLDRLKSEFVSLVSHELRGPLTNVAGGIELILARPGTLPVKLTETLTLMQVEIRRLTQFVETILDLSALEAGRLPLNPAPLPLSRVVEAVRQQFAATPAGQRLRLSVPPDLPPALADERGLASVLFHLVDNALKYAPEGEVVVEAGISEGRLRVRVRDHGPGIAPEARALIFEKFQRLNTGDAQAVYGHGLGLYMVRRLLQAMQGNIQVEPAPEGGAQFTFWLPAAQDEA